MAEGRISRLPRAAAASAAAALLLLAGACGGEEAMPILDAAGVAAEVQSRAAEGVLVVNLWATWCLPCMKELPAFAAVARRRADLQFVGLSFDWTAAGADAALEADCERASAIWNRLKMPFDSLYCSEVDIDPVADLWHLDSGELPQTLVFRSGRLVKVHAGSLSEAELEEMVDASR